MFLPVSKQPMFRPAMAALQFSQVNYSTEKSIEKRKNIYLFGLSRFFPKNEWFCSIEAQIKTSE